MKIALVQFGCNAGLKPDILLVIGKLERGLTGYGRPIDAPST
jgi:hypothetical protein